MFTDNTLIFSSAQAITSTANATNLYDITGAGSGNAPTMIGGNAGVIGADMGAGDGEAIPYVVMNVVQAFVSGGGATLTVSLQAAPDNGSNVAGSYTVLYQSAAFTAANLALGETLLFPIPPRALSGVPGEALPRFYQVVYTVGTSTFSAGKVTTEIVLNPPTSLTGTLYPNNFIAV